MNTTGDSRMRELRRVLVTGGAGFIGSSIVRLVLQETRASVVVLDDRLGEARAAELERLSVDCELWSSRIAHLDELLKRASELSEHAREQRQRCQQALGESGVTFFAPTAGTH